LFIQFIMHLTVFLWQLLQFHSRPVVMSQMLCVGQWYYVNFEFFVSVVYKFRFVSTSLALVYVRSINICKLFGCVADLRCFSFCILFVVHGFCCCICSFPHFFCRLYQLFGQTLCKIWLPFSVIIATYSSQ
jgi:hypothetical protein